MSTSKKAVANKKRSHQKKAPAAATGASNNAPNRPHVATRSPVEMLTATCANQANRSKGQTQQEWFALGSYIAQFRQSEAVETRTMAAGAGS